MSVDAASSVSFVPQQPITTTTPGTVATPATTVTTQTGGPQRVLQPPASPEAQAYYNQAYADAGSIRNMQVPYTIPDTDAAPYTAPADADATGTPNAAANTEVSSSGSGVVATSAGTGAGPASGTAATPGCDTQPHYVDDGSLDTNNHTCDDLSSQPLVPAGGKWDARAILNAQSQLETAEPPSANGQESRCGDAAVLGAAVMAGPNATARLAERLAQSPYNTDPGMRKDLESIRNKILDGTATHGDLSHLQQYMYQTYSPLGGGTDVDGMTLMEQDLSDKCDVPAEQNTSGPNATQSDGAGKNLETPAATQQRISQLKNGQSFILNVKMNPGDTDVHHYVTIGKDNQGHTYVYDPYPRDNQPNVIYRNENQGAFDHYVNGSATVTGTNNGAATPINVWTGGTMQNNPS
jgi:hypothetical protein